MNKWIIRTPYSIRDLRVNLEERLSNISTLRSRVPIAVVDDQPLPAKEHLRNHHYSITSFVDIEDVTQVQNYAIVLCDLSGVGTRLHEKLQGAHVISEIKRNYPVIYVIAYTAATRPTTISNQASRMADDFLKKDADIDEWVDTLDVYVRKASDPSVVWRKFRHQLLDSGATPYELTVLEHEFVTNYPKGASVAAKNMQKDKIIGGLQAGTRDVVLSFVGSALFSLLFSA